MTDEYQFTLEHKMDLEHRYLQKALVEEEVAYEGGRHEALGAGVRWVDPSDLPEATVGMPGRTQDQHQSYQHKHKTQNLVHVHSSNGKCNKILNQVRVKHNP